MAENHVNVSVNGNIIYDQILLIRVFRVTIETSFFNTYYYKLRLPKIYNFN